MNLSDKIGIIIDRIAAQMGRGLQPNEKQALVIQLTKEWYRLAEPVTDVAAEPIGPLEVIYHLSREDLPRLLNAANLTGHGAEIGVFRGDYSHALLSAWKGERLYLVDPWCHFDTDYDDALNVGNEEQEERYRSTVERLSEFGDRAHILRNTSEDAAAIVPDGTLDFVYIDANHSFEACRHDIQLWWPKIKPGGLLGGHDYLGGRADIGVIHAVNEFLQTKGLPGVLLANSDCSWFCRKPPGEVLEIFK